MNINPYQSPDFDNAVISSRQSTTVLGGSSSPFFLLIGMATVTIFLAAIDALQEGVPGFMFVLQVTIGSVVAQLPGLLCGELHRRFNTRYSLILLAPAFFVAAVSVVVYVMYVMAAQVQTSKNTAQMHVIFMPILLAVVAFVAYATAGVAAGIYAVLNRNAG